MRRMTLAAVMPLVLTGITAGAAAAIVEAPTYRDEIPRRVGSYTIIEVDPAEWNAEADRLGVVSFVVDGDAYVFQLRSNEVRAQGAWASMRLPDGSEVPAPLPPSRVFLGDELEGKTTYAVFYITPTDIGAYLKLTEGKNLFIESVREHSPSTPPGVLFAYDPTTLWVPPEADLDMPFDSVVSYPAPATPVPDGVELAAYTYENTGRVVADAAYYNRFGGSYSSRIDYIKSISQAAYDPFSLRLRTAHYTVDTGINTGSTQDSNEIWNDFKARWPYPDGTGIEENALFSANDWDGCAAGQGWDKWTVNQLTPDGCHLWDVPNTDYEEAIIYGHETGHTHAATHDRSAQCNGGRSLMEASLWYDHCNSFSSANEPYVRSHVTSWGY